MFWLFAGVCIIGLLVVRKVLPETKGCRLEDIERDHYGESVSDN